MQYVLFSISVFVAVFVLGDFGVGVNAQTVVESNHTSVQTSITSRASTGGNSARGSDGIDGADGQTGVQGATGADGQDGADGRDGAPGSTTQGTSRSYVEIRTVVDGKTVVDERHEVVGEPGESVSTSVRSQVRNGEAATDHETTIGDRVISGDTSAAVAHGLPTPDQKPAESSASHTVQEHEPDDAKDGAKDATHDGVASEHMVEQIEEEAEADQDESKSRSPWTFITGLFNKFITYVGSFFS